MGEGAGPVCTTKLHQALLDELDETVDKIFLVKSADQLRQKITDEVVKTNMAIVIPGGNAAHMASKLKTIFPDIRRSVFDGATYLGICAGAMLASSQIILNNNPFFEKGSLLSLMPVDTFAGKYVGAVGRFANIETDSKTDSSLKILWNRGGYFGENEHGLITADKDVEIIGHYTTLGNDFLTSKPITGKLPAIIKTIYGKGIVIASQVHLEMGLLENISKDFFEEQLMKETISFVESPDALEQKMRINKMLRSLLEKSGFRLKPSN